MLPHSILRYAKRLTGRVLVLAALWLGWTYFYDPQLIVLRTRTTYSGSEIVTGPKIHEWRLKLPDGIPWRRFGSITGSVYNHGLYTQDRSQWTIVGIWTNFYNGKLIPWIENRNAQSFSIFIDNKPFKALGRTFDTSCLTATNLARFQVSTYSCTSESINCSILIDFHGWNAEASVHRTGLYSRPDLVCDILNKALSDWTISIDELRSEPNKER